jgi:two-component system chemotaxis response regulator CheY
VGTGAFVFRDERSKFMAFRVLIVDDSPVMRAFIRRIIVLSGMEGTEFLEASDGREALKLLREQWVDLVLTDINMPSMDGEQLMRCLEADDMLRSVPVVVVSTDGTESRMHQMLSLGARGYVKKPFMPETLREELERVLGGAYAG